MGPVEEEWSGVMLVRWVMSLLVPVALAAALTGCNDGGVQPGVVNTSAAQGYRGETGRVVEIREVPIKRGGSGMNDGTLIGGGGNDTLISGAAGDMLVSGTGNWNVTLLLFASMLAVSALCWALLNPKRPLFAEAP